MDHHHVTDDIISHMIDDIISHMTDDIINHMTDDSSVCVLYLHHKQINKQINEFSL